MFSEPQRIYQRWKQSHHGGRRQFSAELSRLGARPVAKRCFGLFEALEPRIALSATSIDGKAFVDIGPSDNVAWDQPRVTVESVSPPGIVGAFGLKVIQLSWYGPRNEDAPDVAPAVGVGIEANGLGRFRVVDVVVKQQSHRGCRSTDDHELHAAVMNQRAVRKQVSELKLRMRMCH